MWIRRIVWGLAFLHISLLHASNLKLGSRAPELTATDCDGRNVRLSGYHGRQAVVLLERARGAPWDQHARSAACGNGGDSNAVVLFSTGAVMPMASAAPGELRAALIDAGGVVRRVGTGQFPNASSVAGFFKLWRDGQETFEAFCVRCHGQDGTLNLCEGVKPLAGIGGRLTPEEIRTRMRIGELNQDEVLIRDQFIKRRDVDALIVYICGL
jgi:hypothetical protein